MLPAVSARTDVGAYLAASPAALSALAARLAPPNGGGAEALPLLRAVFSSSVVAAEAAASTAIPQVQPNSDSSAETHRDSRNLPWWLPARLCFVLGAVV